MWSWVFRLMLLYLQLFALPIAWSMVPHRLFGQAPHSLYPLKRFADDISNAPTLVAQVESAVAVWDDWAAVGDVSAAVDRRQAGAVKLLKHVNGSWVHHINIGPPTDEFYLQSYFGASVAMARGVLVVGAPRTTVAGIAVGRVHTFALNRAANEWQICGWLSAPPDSEKSNTQDLQFGSQVALYGALLLASGDESRLVAMFRYSTPDPSSSSTCGTWQLERKLYPMLYDPEKQFGKSLAIGPLLPFHSARDAAAVQWRAQPHSLIMAVGAPFAGLQGTGRVGMVIVYRMCALRDSRCVPDAHTTRQELLQGSVFNQSWPGSGSRGVRTFTLAQETQAMDAWWAAINTTTQADIRLMNAQPQNARLPVSAYSPAWDFAGDASGCMIRGADARPDHAQWQSCRAGGPRDITTAILGTVEAEAVLVPQDKSGIDDFGACVGLASGRLAAGAPGHSSVIQGGGAVYMYRRTGPRGARTSPWVLEQKLMATVPSAVARFGAQLAIAREWLAVTAPGESVSTGQTGAIYIFQFDDVLQLWRVMSRTVPPTTTGQSLLAGRVVAAHGMFVTALRNMASLSPAQEGSGTGTDTTRTGTSNSASAIAPSSSQHRDTFGSRAYQNGSLMVVSPFSPPPDLRSAFRIEHSALGMAAASLGAWHATAAPGFAFHNEGGRGRVRSEVTVWLHTNHTLVQPAVSLFPPWRNIGRAVRFGQGVDMLRVVHNHTTLQQPRSRATAESLTTVGTEFFLAVGAPEETEAFTENDMPPEEAEGLVTVYRIKVLDEAEARSRYTVQLPKRPDQEPTVLIKGPWCADSLDWGYSMLDPTTQAILPASALDIADMGVPYRMGTYPLWVPADQGAAAHNTQSVLPPCWPGFSGLRSPMPGYSSPSMSPDGRPYPMKGRWVYVAVEEDGVMEPWQGQTYFGFAVALTHTRDGEVLLATSAPRFRGPYARPPIGSGSVWAEDGILYVYRRTVRGSMRSSMSRPFEKPDLKLEGRVWGSWEILTPLYIPPVMGVNVVLNLRLGWGLQFEWPLLLATASRGKGAVESPLGGAVVVYSMCLAARERYSEVSPCQHTTIAPSPLGTEAHKKRSWLTVLNAPDPFLVAQFGFSVSMDQPVYRYRDLQARHEAIAEREVAQQALVTQVVRSDQESGNRANETTDWLSGAVTADRACTVNPCLSPVQALQARGALVPVWVEATVWIGAPTDRQLGSAYIAKYVCPEQWMSLAEAEALTGLQEGIVRHEGLAPPVGLCPEGHFVFHEKFNGASYISTAEAELGWFVHTSHGWTGVAARLDSSGGQQTGSITLLSRAEGAFRELIPPYTMPWTTVPAAIPSELNGTFLYAGQARAEEEFGVAAAESLDPWSVSISTPPELPIVQRREELGSCFSGDGTLWLIGSRERSTETPDAQLLFGMGLMSTAWLPVVYVRSMDPYASDKNPGTQHHPLRTLQAAVHLICVSLVYTVPSSLTVELGPGEYDLRALNALKCTHIVTIRATKPTQSTRTSSGEMPVLVLTAADVLRVSQPLALEGVVVEVREDSIRGAGTRQTRIIVASSRFIAVDSVFRGGFGFKGGVIYASNSVVRLFGCTFEQNNAGSGGAIYMEACDAVVRGCRFAHNAVVSDHGGGVFATGSQVNIIGTSFYDNEAKLRGGAVYTSLNTDLHIRDCVMAGNQAGQAGGAVAGDLSTITVVNSVLMDNTAKAGGGVIVEAASSVLLVLDSVLFGNEATSGLGGAIWLDGQVSSAWLHRSVFTENAATAGSGGAIAATARSRVILTACNLTGNAAAIAGGAVYTDASDWFSTGPSTSSVRPPDVGELVAAAAADISLPKLLTLMQQWQGDDGITAGVGRVLQQAIWSVTDPLRPSSPPLVRSQWPYPPSNYTPVGTGCVHCEVAFEGEGGGEQGLGGLKLPSAGTTLVLRSRFARNCAGERGGDIAAQTGGILLTETRFSSGTVPCNMGAGSVGTAAQDKLDALRTSGRIDTNSLQVAASGGALSGGGSLFVSSTLHPFDFNRPDINRYNLSSVRHMLPVIVHRCLFEGSIARLGGAVMAQSPMPADCMRLGEGGDNQTAKGRCATWVVPVLLSDSITEATAAAVAGHAVYWAGGRPVRMELRGYQHIPTPTSLSNPASHVFGISDDPFMVSADGIWLLPASLGSQYTQNHQGNPGIVVGSPTRLQLQRAPLQVPPNTAIPDTSSFVLAALDAYQHMVPVPGQPMELQAMVYSPGSGMCAAHWNASDTDGIAPGGQPVASERQCVLAQEALNTPNTARIVAGSTVSVDASGSFQYSGLVVLAPPNAPLLFRFLPTSAAFAAALIIDPAMVRVEGCVAGTQPSGSGCESCQAGTYSTDGTACVRCEGGSVTQDSRGTVCQPCIAGWREVGRVVCEVCAEGTMTGLGRQSCQSCPAGVVCVGGSVDIPQGLWWDRSSALDVQRLFGSQIVLPEWMDSNNQSASKQLRRRAETETETFLLDDDPTIQTALQAIPAESVGALVPYPCVRPSHCIIDVVALGLPSIGRDTPLSNGSTSSLSRNGANTTERSDSMPSRTAFNRTVATVLQTMLAEVPAARFPEKLFALRCRPGHEGVLCAICADGFAMIGRHCEACWPVWANVLIMIVGVAAACGLLWYLVRDTLRMQSEPTDRPRTSSSTNGNFSRATSTEQRKLGRQPDQRARVSSDGRLGSWDVHEGLVPYAVRIVVNFVQLAALVSELNVETPNFFGDVMSIASSSSGGISLHSFPMQCLARSTYFARVGWALALLPVVAAISWPLLHLYAAYQTRRHQNEVDERILLQVNGVSQWATVRRKRGSVWMAPPPPTPQISTVSPLAITKATPDESQPPVTSQGHFHSPQQHGQDALGGVGSDALSSTTEPGSVGGERAAGARDSGILIGGAKVGHIFFVVIITTFFLCFTQLTKTFLSVFRLHPGTVDGKRYLAADFRVQQDTLQYASMAAAAGIGVALYVFVLPYGALWLLHRERFNLDNATVRQRFGFLYTSYKSQMYWWEGVVLGRKIAVLCVVSVARDGFLQAFMCSIVVGAALAVQLIFQPFHAKLLNLMEGVLLCVLYATQLCAMLLWRYPAWSNAVGIMLLALQVLAPLSISYPLWRHKLNSMLRPPARKASTEGLTENQTTANLTATMLQRYAVRAGRREQRFAAPIGDPAERFNRDSLQLSSRVNSLGVGSGHRQDRDESERCGAHSAENGAAARRLSVMANPLIYSPVLRGRVRGRLSQTMVRRSMAVDSGTPESDGPAP